ncbi:MAG: thymidylate kinase [Peptococcaceae bacterium BICA1-8]|nr:MAG: thymidylate kinase [Peptococcaceae bacterium BICA1-8]
MGGIFITLEGCDGSGKTTQVDLLKKRLKELEIPCLVTREPGGTPISEKVRSIILDEQNNSMVWRTEALLYAASRAQLIGENIVPSLNNGIHVICDRYVDSTLAYQGYGRGLNIDDLIAINDFATSGLKPHLTILLDIKPEEAIQRFSRRKTDRLEKEKLEFHQRVREGYLQIAKKEPDRFKIINALESIKEVHEEILNKVLSTLIN